MNKILLLTGILLFSISCVAVTKNEVVKKDAKTEIKASKKEKHGIRPTILTTKSGYKFWYLQTNNTPKIKIYVLFRNAGSAHQTLEKSSLPALYANSIWCGAGSFNTRAELLARFSELSMSISSKADADNVHITFDVITVDKNDVEEAFKLFLTVISKPKFNENEVKTERDDLSEWLTTSTYSKILSLIFPNHPYSWGKDGTTESLQKISINDLKDFGKHYLTRSNASIYIGGDISPKEASGMCEQILANLPEGKVIDELTDVEPVLDGSISKYYTNGSQTIVNFILKGISTEELKERVTARLLFRILGGGDCFKSRIISILRSQKGLIYSGGVNCINYDHAHLARGCLFIDNNKVDETIKAVKEILTDLYEHGVTQDELDFFKANFKGRMAVALRTSQKLHRFFSATMAEKKSVSELDDLLKIIDEITLGDVNNMAKRLLKDVRFVVNGGEK